MTDMQVAAAPTSVRALRASRVVAAEVRAEAARQGISISQLAERMGRTQPWMSRRLKPASVTEITLDETLEMAEALDVPVERFLSVLPRLDSNQQPSGFPFEQVSDVWSDPFDSGPLLPEAA